MEKADVPKGFSVAVARGQITDCPLQQVTYFTGHETIIATGRQTGMARWRKSDFCANASQCSAARRLFQYSKHPGDGNWRRVRDLSTRFVIRMAFVAMNP
jgi:K+ transporter